MKKIKGSKILSALLLVALIVTSVMPLGSFTASAATESDFEYVSFSGSAYIQKYTGNAENVVIPNTLGGNTVTTIDDNAFKNCVSVKSVTIPGTVTRIDTNAFEGCVSLESINLPTGLTYIGSKAFYRCESLKEIVIPSTVTYIGPEILSYCYALDAIEVDSGSRGYVSVDGVLMDIGKTSIIQYPAGKTDEAYAIASTIRSIKQSAFAGNAYIKEITMQSTINQLYDYAFADCTGIEGFTITSNINSIGSYVFDGCSSLKEFVVVPENSSFIAIDGVLFNKSQNRLVRYPCAKDNESYTIPKTVSYTDYGAFADCINLTEIVIHKTVTNFRNDTFRGCTGLTKITIPSSVYAVGTNTFEGCTALTTINAATLNNYYSAKNGVLFNKDKTKIVFFPIGSEITSYTIPDTVTTIESRAFVNPTNLTSLTIPTTVTTIRSDAFVDCDNLTIYAKMGSYAYNFAVSNGLNVVSTDIVKSVSHTASNGKIIFTVTTKAGDYSRIKLTTSDNLGGSLAVASTYEVNADGDYVWTIKADVPKTATEYAFDLRSSATGKYLKEYSLYTAEVISTIKSVSYEKTNGKIIFTVTTSAGDFNRIKVALAEDLKGYVAYTDSYTVNANGDYVWTITAKAEQGEQEYAFDLRSSETGKYIRDYLYYTVTPSIKKVSCISYDGMLTFNVVTCAGEFDRLRCGTSTSTVGNLANANYYITNSGGDFVWTIAIEEPSESTTLYFDLRNESTGKFIKDYFVFDYVA
ncbi:MAG: leucine-rich repeat domain-containing protein [Clostridia bacterium]|nr:leucine-rich repeat domain-containing protein [Clostridia bacterium]